MLFSSLTFIFVFLPIVCFIYWLVRPAFRNTVLLLASILFYAWGEPLYVLVMISTILVNYFGALAVDRFKYKKIALATTIAVDLAVLFYFKYFDFFVENINLLFDSKIDPLKVVMPIGISFYTFQAISYVVDVYRGDANVQRNLYKLGLYISLFPQLVAGPIVKYHDVEEQIDHRQPDWNSIALGLKRFIIGLSKKVIIANTMGALADDIFNQQIDFLSTPIAWVGAISYTLQIFFDFSGYSDMAIGLGLLFGFKFKENFNYPYISKTITEFWRRWHISLSTWFKEYLYIPLGGNRISPARTYLNIGIVFLLTGFWHGANWTFIVWGLWHGFFNIIEKTTGLTNDTQVKWKEGLKHVYALLIVVVGWVLFRADSLKHAGKFLKQMFFGGSTQQILTFDYYVGGIEIVVGLVAIALSMPIISDKLYTQPKNSVANWCINALLLLLLVVCISFLSMSTYNPFIYFRF